MNKYKRKIPTIVNTNPIETENPVTAYTKNAIPNGKVRSRYTKLVYVFAFL